MDAPPARFIRTDVLWFFTRASVGIGLLWALFFLGIEVSSGVTLSLPGVARLLAMQALLTGMTFGAFLVPLVLEAVFREVGPLPGWIRLPAVEASSARERVAATLWALLWLGLPWLLSQGVATGLCAGVASLGWLALLLRTGLRTGVAWVASEK